MSAAAAARNVAAFGDAAAKGTAPIATRPVPDPVVKSVNVPPTGPTETAMNISPPTRQASATSSRSTLNWPAATGTASKNKVWHAVPAPALAKSSSFMSRSPSTATPFSSRNPVYGNTRPVVAPCAMLIPAVITSSRAGHWRSRRGRFIGFSEVRCAISGQEGR